MLKLVDIRTLAIVSSLLSLVLCTCMISIARTRKTYNGFYQWSAASVVYSFALAFMSLRSIFPDFISIIVANSLIIAGIGFIANGIERFVSISKSTWFFAGCILLTALSFSYYTYFSPNVNTRIVIISSVIAASYTYIAYLLHTYIPPLLGGKNMLLVLTFLFQAFWSLLRILQVSFLEGPIVNFMGASEFHAVTIAVFFCGNVFIVVGLISLNFQRVEFDLSAMTEEVKTLRGIIPICSYCKKIRDDKGYWSQVEAYIGKHTGAAFSHGICPQCLELHHPEVLKELAANDS